MNITFICDENYMENGYSVGIARAFIENGDAVRLILPFSKNKRISTSFIGKLKLELPIGIIDAHVYHGINAEIPTIYIDIGAFESELNKTVAYAEAVICAMDALSSYPDYLFTDTGKTALIPVLLKTKYRKNPYLSGIRTLHYINDTQFGVYSKARYAHLLGIDNDNMHLVSSDKEINMVKGAILCTNRVFIGENCISMLYDKESSLHHCAVQFGFKIRKLRMGINYEQFDPEIDKDIAYNFNASNLKCKQRNKKYLQRYYGFEENENIPLIAVYTHTSREIITRLTKESKRCDFQLIFLHSIPVGSSSYLYETETVTHEKEFSLQKIKTLFAGCDFAIFDTLNSPYGNPSYIASAYGCVPIVPSQKYFDIGISYFNKITVDGNGYTFDPTIPQDMLYTIWDALGVYKHSKKIYTKLVQNCMKKAFPVSDAVDIIKRETEKTSYISF